MHANKKNKSVYPSEQILSLFCILLRQPMFIRLGVTLIHTADKATIYHEALSFGCALLKVLKMFTLHSEC